MEVLAGHVFISYVREDSANVDRLQAALHAAGIPVWRDTADLWPGEDWRVNIRRAITEDALVFIACFSKQGLVRAKSYQNEELLLAIEQLRLRRPDASWLIPVRFDDCPIPLLELGGGRTLHSIQHIDLFEDKREAGLARLVATILRILGDSPKSGVVKQAAVLNSNPALSTLSARRDAPRLPEIAGALEALLGGEQPKFIAPKGGDPAAGDPLIVSGDNSKVFEITLPSGAYRVSWAAEGKGFFALHHETAGQSTSILSAALPKPNSGEAVMRITQEGRQVFSVKASNISWVFKFSPL
jgi:TIR domain